MLLLSYSIKAISSTPGAYDDPQYVLLLQRLKSTDVRSPQDARNPFSSLTPE
jgi:hypothetical protein